MISDKDKKEARPTTMMSLLIRILVGGYLLYLAISMKDSISFPPTSENMFVTIAAVVFAIAGLVLILLSAKSLAQGNYEGGSNDTNKDEE